MTIERITSSTPQWAAVRKLYENVYPEGTRLDYEKFLNVIRRDDVDFLTFYDHAQLIGFSFAIRHKDVAWLYYFALNREVRTLGYEGIMLSKIEQQYANHRLVVNLEQALPPADSDEERVHRHNSFLKAGFRDTSALRKAGGRWFRIMLLGKGDFTNEDYDRLLEIDSEWWAKTLC